MTGFPASRPAAARGIALVITLSLLALITILVVGFTASMRTERQASHSMAENERSKLIAQSALVHAIALLDNNIPQPVAPGAYPAPTPVNWIVNPGLLTTVTGTGASPTITKVPLSSNPTTSYQPKATDANLNVPQLITPSFYTILPTSDPMRVAWVPLLQNPMQAASPTNPIMARYAFWIDDENAKVNVNTAYGKPPGMDYSKLTPGVIMETSTSPAHTDAYPLGHPGSVNLDVFGTAIDPKGLMNNLWTNGVMSSADGIETVVNGGSDPNNAFYQANKFYLTAASRDPEFNVFGKSRLFMFGSSPALLGNPLFQRFRDLDAPMYFHGNENMSAASLDRGAMYYTAASLSNIFNRSDWPGMPARSFVQKWDTDANGNPFTGTAPGDVGRREADQVAWNTVLMGSFTDFDFSQTRPAPVTLPGQVLQYGNGIPVGKTGSSGSINYPNAAVQVGSLSGKVIVPAAPRPMVDEICLNILPVPSTSTPGKCNLKFTATYGLWLPPGYPAADFSQTSCDIFIGLTHLDYTVSQTGASEVASQSDTKYLNYGYAGVDVLQGSLSTGTLAPGGRMLVPTVTKGNPPVVKGFVARPVTSPGFSTSTVGAVNFNPDPKNFVNVDVKMRLYVRSNNGTTGPALQLIPAWDTHDPGSTAASTRWDSPTPSPGNTSQVYKVFNPPPDDNQDYVEFSFKLDLSRLSGQLITRSLQVADPRTGNLARSWVKSWLTASNQDQPGVANTDTVNAPQNAATVKAVAAGWNLKKFAYVDMSAGAPVHPSIGMFSLVPTGMQQGIVGATFKLQPNSNPAELPDWLLLDLIAPTSTSNAWPDLTRMNSTAGKINLNAAIYPQVGGFTPPPRTLPMQALFTNTPASGAVSNIINHTTVPGSAFAGAKFYSYPGEICEIQGVADQVGASDWDKEAVVRNFASAFTTKSNTFCVWGVTQTIKKLVSHAQYGVYENGDFITGEKRFQAIVERYVWPGADGIAGNGHTKADGTYDRLTQGASQPGAVTSSSTAATWEALDGPDAPTYPTSDFADGTLGAFNQYAASAYTGNPGDPIESAYNPVRAVMKYRVISFRYLDQ